LFQSDFSIIGLYAAKIENWKKLGVEPESYSTPPSKIEIDLFSAS